jgi:hypothetical protein
MMVSDLVTSLDADASPGRRRASGGKGGADHLGAAMGLAPMPVRSDIRRL